MNVFTRSAIKAIRQPVIQVNNNRSATFKSAISLSNIYPNSTLKLTTPQKPVNVEEKFSGYIPIDQLEITYSKSTGPGGQNVNKVNTKVDLRFHLESANWIDADIKKNLADKLKTRITNEGYLIFRSDVTRSQLLNVADCLEKLRTAIRNATHCEVKPTPETAEKHRRRQEKAIIERLMVKRHKSNIKQGRQAPSTHDVM